jgi:uncharacterized membrane protein YhaH (DUF805 family)
MSDSVWHVTVAGQAQGPFTLAEVLARVGGDLGPDTLVWNPNLSGWLPLSAVPELAARLHAPRPAAPAAPSAPAPSTPAAMVRPAQRPLTASRPQPRASAEEEPTLNPFKLIARSFRWRGKFNRGEFAMLSFGGGLINTIFLCLVVGIAFLLSKSIASTSGQTTMIVLCGIVVALDAIAAALVNLGALIRRLNDLGKSPWWVLGAFVPLLGGLLFLYLLFAPSDPEAEMPESFTGVALALAGMCVLSLVVGAIVAAIVLPALLRAKTSANESAARGDLRALLSAQMTYAMSNGGAYESRLECLRKPDSGCIPSYSGPVFVDATLGIGPRHGYQLRLQGGAPPSSPGLMSPSSVNTFVALSTPTQPGTNGARSFCIDQTGMLCSVTGASADDLIKTENGEVSCSSVCVPTF